MSGLRLIAALIIALFFSVSAHAQTVPTSPAQISLSFAPVVKKAAPAVVNIYTKRTVRERVAVSPFANDPFFRQFFGNSPAFQGGVREREVASLGSGVIIQSDGLIVTSHHVIKDADAITVVLADRREFEAEVAKRDPQTDLAFLRIKGASGLPALAMRDTDTLEVGELALAIGNPFGVGQTVTQGIISALARNAQGVSDYQFFIQTDAAINPGNSGGALVDMEGRLIGINTAIYSTSGGSNGIGFAIPANMVQAVQVSEVKEGRVVRPWLGLTVQPMTAEIANSLGLPATTGGAIVRKVSEGSPSQKAGIREGDVITAVGKYTVNDWKEIIYRVGTQKLGGTVEFTLLRQNAPLKVSVALVPAPEAKPDTRTLKGNHPLAGAQVATLTQPLAIEYGVDDSGEAEGVIVLGGKVKAAIGLTKGDIILQVNGQNVTSAAQLEKLMSAGKGSWNLVVRRGAAILSLSIRM